MSQNTTAMQRGAGGETTGATDMTTRQPEALRLAEILEGGYSLAWLYERGGYEVSAELRRQHALIAELESQLEAIGAGGVSGPLIGQPQAMPDLSQLTERGAKAWAGVDAQGLREGFTAADMATAAAQGFRDGWTAAQAISADPAGATEMENLQRTAVGWQERALRAERNWVVCRRWAIAGGAPVEKLGDDPDQPFHAASPAIEGESNV